MLSKLHLINKHSESIASNTKSPTDCISSSITKQNFEFVTIRDCKAGRVDYKNIHNIFPSPKALNLVKNQWIKTKLKIDLYLGMVKQCTKYQMNI
jgi:hypothetical protein